MPYCEVSKAKIYYEVIGEGTPMIMVHGFGLDHRIMKGCMEPIFQQRSDIQRIYFDLPGMGKTKDYDRIHHADDMLEAVLEFIHSIIPNQSFLLAGESYGGYLARGVMVKQKEKVAGLALLCPVIKPKKQERVLPPHTILYKDESLLSRLSQMEKEKYLSENVVLNEKNWHRYKNEVYVGFQKANQDFLTRIEKNYGLTFSVDEGFYDKPVVFIVGKQDSVVGYKDAFHILDHYPLGTYAVLDRAGHYLQIEQDELFVKLINEWLDRIETETSKFSNSK
ncbi:Pimeloyl-ACP methyl ester carboxylesterase [Oceanobacillus limi]|uniref:Pimeloyl-ACP methyl ester carboxylesterase n=1 Tax=Oceanobacillus limi TaxID=930131 RepID=A0A1H9Y6K2_9BACI|nr:alpha/beta hydrolase [Oceanobacillus limi]SES64450.1 Pimeloyl-ACP methyl ester carboxylesterase [Oceanobacillus limi]